MSVVRREIIPMPRRNPGSVAASVEMVEDWRPVHENRSDDIIGSVDKRRTDYLHICCSACRSLADKSSNILIHIRTNNSLDKEYMVESVYCFQDAEIIHKTVSIQIQIGNDV